MRKASAERIATDVLGDHTRTLLFGNGALEIWTGGLHVWKIGGRLIDVFGDLDHSLDKDLIVRESRGEVIQHHGLERHVLGALISGLELRVRHLVQAPA